MITGTYLHHHPEFKQLIQIVSDRLTIEPVLVESFKIIMDKIKEQIEYL